MNEVQLKECIEGMLKGDDTFKYGMLSRLQDDCENFLSPIAFGYQSTRALWAKNVNHQIQIMTALHNALDVKPIWLTMEQLHDYERRMTAM